MKHTGYHTEISPVSHKIRAVCTCGWRSGWFSSGGLAGASWDQHKEKK